MAWLVWAGSLPSPPHLHHQAKGCRTPLVTWNYAAMEGRAESRTCPSYHLYKPNCLGLWLLGESGWEDSYGDKGWWKRIIQRGGDLPGPDLTQCDLLSPFFSIYLFLLLSNGSMENKNKSHQPYGVGAFESLFCRKENRLGEAKSFDNSYPADKV